MESSFKIPEELEAQYGELVELEHTIYDLSQELDLKGKAFWGAVERKYNVRGKRLRLDQETRTIHVMAKEEMPPGVALPKIPGKNGKPVAVRMDREQMGSALPVMTEEPKGIIGKAKDALGL